MRHKLREISPERLSPDPCNGTPEYSIKIRFFDPDGITILGDPDEIDEFPDILTEQAFQMDITHELEPVSPKVTTRFKEEVFFGPDYTPDLRSEEVTLYKHRKRDLSFADYHWYTSSVYIKPKVSPPVHRTTVFLYPEENYISSVVHEVEQCRPIRKLELNDARHDVFMNNIDVTESHLRSWDAKFTLDEDQLEMQLREMDDFKNKIKQDNIPTIFEGIELDADNPEWDDIPGGSLKRKEVKVNLHKMTYYHKNDIHIKLNGYQPVNDLFIDVNTNCDVIHENGDVIHKNGDVMHKTCDENSNFEDLHSPDYVDTEGVDGRIFEELDV